MVKQTTLREKYYKGYLDPVMKIVWGELGKELFKGPNLDIYE